MICSGFPLALLSLLLLVILCHVTASFPLLCGQELVNAVAFVCDGRGYYGQPSKRSAGVFELESRAKTFLKSGISRGELGRSKRRVRTGLIVTECCHNRCSVSHLESYCNPLPQDAVHDPEVHIRLEKSAEEDADEGRPQDGPSQVDTATGTMLGTDTSESRGRVRIDAVEKVISGRLIPTSTMGSSTTPSRKKPRKDKSERRKSSREEKQARREERRRNRERSSGGKSRSGRRKNKDNDRSSRAKRQGLTLWRNMFSQKALSNTQALENQHILDSLNGIAPSSTIIDTFETETLLQQEKSLQDGAISHTKQPSINADEDRNAIFSDLMTKLRTLVLDFTSDR
ncbi:uncharacterized protein LOC121406148 [Lytechinus variegatus]|uniref:uncharacterized protein LOC121406148 n=1 Tax=Lytechinus variegatus TaxID=7654 RepID=UPI001BB2CCFE|nr:uncharacterized protein LOC121406148 [Lytechinus variegatus]